MTGGDGATPGQKTHAVIFDGSCDICRRVIRKLDKWDVTRSLEILPAQSSGVRGRFSWIDDAAFTKSLQVVRLSDGRTWQGAAAIEQLLRALPRGRWIRWAFSIPLVRPLAERFYRWFARNRYRMRCGAHCPSSQSEAVQSEDG